MRLFQVGCVKPLGKPAVASQLEVNRVEIPDLTKEFPDVAEAGAGAFEYSDSLTDNFVVVLVERFDKQLAFVAGRDSGERSP